MKSAFKPEPNGLEKIIRAKILHGDIKIAKQLSKTAVNMDKFRPAYSIQE